MVQTITPVGHGGSKGRWAGSAALYIVATTSVAAVFGAMLGGAGVVMGAPWGATATAATAAVALGYLAREVWGLAIPIPAARRQVPEWWRTFFSPRVAAVLYGAGLGIGFLTYLPAGTLAAVGVAALVSGTPAPSAVLMGAFGLGRSLTILLAADATSASALDRVQRRVDRLASPRAVRWANAAALAAVVVAAAGWMRHAGPLRPDDLGQLAGVAVAATFAVAFLAKITAPGAWRSTLRGYELPPRVARTARWGVPSSEVAVPILALLGWPRPAAWIASGLLVAFTLATVRARLLRGPRLTCGCFGGARTRDWRALIGRNLALGALTGLWLVAAPAAGLRVPEGRAGQRLPGVLGLV